MAREIKRNVDIMAVQVLAKDRNLQEKVVVALADVYETMLLKVKVKIHQWQME